MGDRAGAEHNIEGGSMWVHVSTSTSHAWTSRATFSNIADIVFSLPQILKDATEFFSRATPNLATVIPAMDHIDTFFTNSITPDSDMNDAIRAAVTLGKKTLNRYYSKTDMVEVYRIAMGM